MKIVIFSFHSGAVERGVESWATNLKSRLNSVEIVARSSNESIIANVLNNIKKIKSSDVVIPTNGRVQVLLVRLISSFFRKPVVVFGHSGPGADDKWNLLCSPNVFVAFSTEQHKWALKYKLPWTKVVLINHAVDTEVFTPATKKPKKKIVLCVAANIPSKRIELVRNAVGMLSGYKFMAVGKGNEIEVSYKKMPEYYKKADVFCFVPESHEAFGLVFLEALATNLPVVTIDDPVRREIVGEAGIFVKNPQNQSELSKAIDTAYNKNWGNKPRTQAMKFSWTKIVQEYENLFSKLI